MTTGERIKKARKERNMTQLELASKMGVTGSLVAQYETGKKKPKLETLQRIANVLGCDWVSLTEEDDPRVAPMIWEELRASMQTDTSLLTRMEVAMSNLNLLGKQKAVERAEELTEIPRYRAQGGIQIPPPPEGQEGDKTPPEEDPVEEGDGQDT